MQLNLEAGDHLPLHASASGKLYLSCLKEKEAIEIFKILKLQNCKNTIIEITQFKNELKNKF